MAQALQNSFGDDRWRRIEEVFHAAASRTPAVGPDHLVSDGSAETFDYFRSDNLRFLRIVHHYPEIIQNRPGRAAVIHYGLLIIHVGVDHRTLRCSQLALRDR